MGYRTHARVNMADTIALAVITSAQGLDGSVKLKLFTNSAANLKNYVQFETRRGQLTLTSLRLQPNATIARFAEIADRTAADLWRGVELMVAKQSLPAAVNDREYYHSDLIGMTVITTDGKSIGCVKSVENYGAGDLLEIALSDTHSVLVPFRDAAVPDVNMHSRIVTVDQVYLE